MEKLCAKSSGSLLLLLLGVAELTSILTLQWLSLPNIPYPWSFLVVIRHALVFEPVACLLLSAILVLVAFGFSRGGVLRFLALSAFAMLIGIAVLCWFGAYAYANYAHIAQLPIRALLSLLKSPAILYQEAPELLGFEAGTFALAILVGAWMVFERYRPANRVLGDARFAATPEIHRAGFFRKDATSVIIGKKWGVPLFSNGFEHVLLFAPSGSGKTRSVAMPNLFHFEGSVVCNDIKFTLFETTSGYRSRVLGQACYCFAPSRPGGRTHRYNPLAMISHDPIQRMTDIQRIAHILIPDTAKDPIWSQASRKLFKALVLFLLDSDDRPTTLGEINRLIKRNAFDAWLMEILNNTDDFDPEFYRNGYSYLNNHEKTRTGILETFSGHFELFDDPTIDAATSASDFSLADLRRNKMTVYVGFTDDDMERLSPLLTLFWQQLISCMIQEVPNPKTEPYPVLCLIDEFSSLGRIERLRRSLKLLREYRVRCILMFQYIAQTYEKYSHDEAKAFTNTKTKIAYTTEDHSDAEFISKMLGTSTRRVASHSTNIQSNGHSSGTSTNLQAVPLVHPHKLTRMNPKIALIMRSGNNPVKATQYIWYRERAMKKLRMPPVDVPVQQVTRTPFVRVHKAEDDEALDLD